VCADSPYAGAVYMYIYVPVLVKGISGACPRCTMQPLFTTRMHCSLFAVHCSGCGWPIHWFCSLGDPDANEAKEHGAQYWCNTCMLFKEGCTGFLMGCSSRKFLY
jgi:hypothetical protein